MTSNVTSEMVLAEAGASGSDEELAVRVLAEAEIHVETYVDVNLISEDNPVPEEVYDSGVLRCAVDLFSRAKAPFGTQILPDGSGQMVAQRLGADPLGGVRPLFARWCLPDLGIA